MKPKARKQKQHDAPRHEHLLSEAGERGPRVEVVLAMFERMLEYEEEVARGERIPQYVVQGGKVVAVGAAMPKTKRQAKEYNR